MSILFFSQTGGWILALIFLAGLVTLGYFYFRQKRENNLKHEFLAMVAHKFRTPLTRIRWQTEEVMKENNFLPEIKDNIVQIDESILELVRLSDLLVNSIKEKDHSYIYKTVSLSEVVKRILESFKNYLASKKIEVTLNEIPDLPGIFVDPERLDSAVHTLIENAINYSPVGGKIKIDLTLEKDTVKFSVTDSGIGIEEKDKSKIFSRFYRGDSARQADTEGVGLGLSMAKEIVERQGGSIGFSSPGPGAGSTFWITFLATRKQNK